MSRRGRTLSGRPEGAASPSARLRELTYEPAEAFRPIERATDLTGVLMLKHEDVFLLTDPFGDIHADWRGLGLYQGDTRVLSTHELHINGQRSVVLRTGASGGFEGALQLTNPDFLRNPGDKSDPEIVLRRQSLGIVRHRLIADGFRERVTVHNFTTHPEPCVVTLRLGADFADIFEVRGVVRERRGSYLPVRLSPERACFAYRGLDGRVWRTYVALSEPAELHPDEPHLRFAWQLPPGGQRQLEIAVWCVVEAAEQRAAERQTPGIDLVAPIPLLRHDAPAAAHHAWQMSSATVSTSNAFAARALKRALADVRMLLNDGPGEGERYVAAGLPWFSCLFGRDTIVTSLQLLSVRPQLAVETLGLLARLQATELDPERDAEPGKILHELRRGELAGAGEIPHRPYYGSVDGTPLWLILLGETERWTGDQALVDRLWPPALAALEWIDRYGDADGDGFVEYERHSRRGLLNQGWKDSADANRWRDGRLAQAPLALVEVQGYVYAARRHMARLARARGEEVLASAQEAAAERLREAFEERFWMPGAGTYALALDGHKRQVDAVGSNPGHALWCGIAAPDRVRQVAAGLLGPQLWSGWGVRTLSSAMAGYNPIGYHIGSVWPHDNAIVAEGLARYGLREQAGQIAGTMLEATSYFRDARLPELFCGFSRDESPYPVPYPVACSPQAWAAGSIFQLLCATLGMRPDAAAHRLELDAPALPDWLPDLRFENLRVGEAVVDLLFARANGSTSVQVLRRTGDLTVVVRV